RHSSRPGRPRQHTGLAGDDQGVLGPAPPQNHKPAVQSVVMENWAVSWLLPVVDVDPSAGQLTASVSLGGGQTGPHKSLHQGEATVEFVGANGRRRSVGQAGR